MLLNIIVYLYISKSLKILAFFKAMILSSEILIFIKKESFVSDNSYARLIGSTSFLK